MRNNNENVSESLIFLKRCLVDLRETYPDHMDDILVSVGVDV